MSDKTWCPGCDSLTSSLNESYSNGWPCDHCGLSNDAWREVLMIRLARDDDEMSARYSELRIKHDKLQREYRSVQAKLTRMEALFNE